MDKAEERKTRRIKKVIDSAELRRANLVVGKFQKQLNELKKVTSKSREEKKKANGLSAVSRGKQESKVEKLKKRGGGKEALKVATLSAKIRTATAKARAIKNALRAKARKEAEAEKAEADLEKAIAAFVAK